MFLSCGLRAAVRSIQLQSGGERGNVSKVHSCCIDHSFRIGCHFLRALRASTAQLWRLIMQYEPEDEGLPTNGLIMLGFILLFALVLTAAYTHGQL